MSGHDALPEQFLDHLKMPWEAECENADRHAVRTRVMVSLATAIVGFTIYATLRGSAMEAFDAVPLGPIRGYTMMGFASLNLLGTSMVLLALLRVLFPEESVMMKVLALPPTVLYLLAWPLRALAGGVFGLIDAAWHRVRRTRPVLEADPDPAPSASWLLSLDEGVLRRRLMNHPALPIIEVRQSAIADLQARNATKRRQLQLAERWLAWGLLWYGAAMAVYLVSVFSVSSGMVGVSANGEDAEIVASG